MRVNGKEYELKGPVSLAEFLQQEGYDAARVAAERNGQIVPKSRFQDTELSETDTLEIVHFVGGG